MDQEDKTKTLLDQQATVNGEGQPPMDGTATTPSPQPDQQAHRADDSNRVGVMEPS